METWIKNIKILCLEPWIYIKYLFPFTIWQRHSTLEHALTLVRFGCKLLHLIQGVQKKFLGETKSGLPAASLVPWPTSKQGGHVAEDENFCGLFCSRRKTANLCHPASKSDGDPVYNLHATASSTRSNLKLIKTSSRYSFSCLSGTCFGTPCRLSEKLCDKWRSLLPEWNIGTFYGYMDTGQVQLYSEYSINQKLNPKYPDFI